MKRLTLAILALSAATAFAADPAAPTVPAPETAALQTIPVDSPAFVFSPGNWTGDAGRAGKEFRQTWYSGAYFRVTWDSKSLTPAAKILLDTSGYATDFKPPKIDYAIDGVWKSNIPCTNEIAVEGIAGTGPHELDVFLQSSEQKERWGGEGKSGLNVLRVTGVQVDEGSHPILQRPKSKWALIVGDSITEGIGTTELAVYSHLVGESLATLGYEYGVSACGWSGWINKGDNPPGDVPGYYMIRNSTEGAGGEYNDNESRWNKIDGNGHSLLDANGHLSAYGRTGEEPALILFNFGTNDALHGSNPSDTLASITQSLAALRAAAPNAEIVILIPFGQYYAKELKTAVAAHKKSHPSDTKIGVIDLGVGVAKNLAAKNGVMGGLHPNDRGHANLAARIIPQVMKLIGE